MRNTGTVTWDDPERQQPYFHQISVGYEREIFTGVSVSVDYVRMNGRDMFLNPNLNIATGTNTTRDGPRTFTDPYGILNPSLAPRRSAVHERRPAAHHQIRLQHLRRAEPVRRAALCEQLEPERTHRTCGVGNDLKLDEWHAPSPTDRRHNFVMSGRSEVPRTRGLVMSGTLRMLSGTPFTIQDDTVDTDMNRINFQPLPAGTYNAFPAAGLHVMKDVESDGGRNGAIGPGSSSSISAPATRSGLAALA